MKILRMVIGIASVLAFFIVYPKACMHTPTSPEDVSGALGFVMSCLFVAAGATGATTRRNKLSGIIAGIIYIIAAIIGFAIMGQQEFIKFWAIASAVAGVFFLGTSLLMKKDLVYGEKPKFK